ncbi:MAG TPA: pyruvate, phosphate dikinase [Actinomycetota bacterium]|nr:pyruvate, phosphate dikinase [Actinomycetota bacterium]
MPTAGTSPSPRTEPGTTRNKNHRYVFDFEEGTKDQKDLLGGKGAGLAEMTNLGLPVPPGFTISTVACNDYMDLGALPESLMPEVTRHLRRLEKKMGRRFGAATNPLLVSVRSGAKFSMPGMMDTVLNLGLNDTTAAGLGAQYGDQRFAADAYRRFVQMFGKIVMGVPGERFEEEIAEVKHTKGYRADTDLTLEDLTGLVARFKAIAAAGAGTAFPDDPMAQLEMAIRAVFASWNGERARIYRRRNKISDHLGTAVNVVSMVFGNVGEGSGTGVAFTRDASTGENKHLAEYLPQAQGEDVVSGARTPLSLDELKRSNKAAYTGLLQVMATLEGHYRDMCDIEFTVEQGRLWILQTRIGKRTAAAAVKIAVDMVKEKLITKEQAVLRVDPGSLDQMLHPQWDPAAEIHVIAQGLNASPGAASGKAVFDAATAMAWADKGEKVILVRPMTEPDDVGGMYASQGILTSRGGKTSHAAVVARGAGTPCVCGAESLSIDVIARRFTVDDTVVSEGDTIAIDGSTGRVAIGAVPLVPAALSADLEKVLRWADGVRRLKVRANADNPEDAAKARSFGAQGIGLARTEHMFLGDRLPAVRRVILAVDADEERAALGELLPLQREDFLGIYEAMSGLPVTIRLLDPPLHEFLPSSKELELHIKELEHELRSAKSDDRVRLKTEIAEVVELLGSVEHLEESNPMLGMRGVRLGVMRPGLFAMQVRAIMEAACIAQDRGLKPVIEIMIPLVALPEELQMARAEAEAVIAEVMHGRRRRIDVLIGTMIELPRAALVAGEIAASADFFSFGTNDLTQTTYGFSRDDVEAKFLAQYLDKGLLKANPFDSLDRAGVGRLMRLAVAEGREARPGLKVGICGEHGGDPASVEFCHQAGMDYVSCSPFRVPVARLAAAHAALHEAGAHGDARGSDTR